MKSIVSLLSIIALGFGLAGCPGSGGGGGAQGFAVSTTEADFGVVGNAYTSTLAVTGGTGPFTWALLNGILPTGTPPNDFVLDPATGIVTGTPNAAGNFTATFTVTDSTGQTVTGAVLFAIHPRTDRVSVDSNGTAGNGASSAPSISADGRYIAFASAATNLLAPGIPAVPAGQQIYVRDRQTGLTSLVSVDNDPVTPIPGNGISSAPSISADGRYVAFVSLATNLLAPDPVLLAGQQIYIHDRQGGQSSLASQDNTNTNVEGAGGASNTPSMNSDGGFVAFFSQATNLVAGSGAHIYVRALP